MLLRTTNVLSPSGKVTGRMQMTVLAASSGGSAIGGLIVIGILWIVPIFVGRRIGDRKGRNGWVWGLLLGWIGVIVVAVLPRRAAGAATASQPGPGAGASAAAGLSVAATALTRPGLSGLMKRCPECDEQVRSEARLCRFCGYRFDPEPT
jgi:hypothetical protein